MPPFKPRAGLGTLLGAGLAASFLSALPAQAVVTAPFPGNTATTCATAPVSGATIFAANFACQIGDKIYSNFRVITDVSSRLLNGSYSFSNTDDNYSLSVARSSNFRPKSKGAGIYTLGYKITVANLAAGNTQRIKTINTSATSSSIGSGVPAWTKTLVASSSDETIGPVTVTQTPTSIVSDGAKDFLTPASYADFVSTLRVEKVRNNFVANFNDTIVQTNPQAPPDSVPGPLPVLGAGAAFGFSRKLRRRIKLSS